MRCKKHYTDLSSINGVCATCLRQRLFILIQQQSQSPSQTLEQDTYHNPAVFPRSVSPYVNRNRPRQHSVPDHRFFSTPQVGPTLGADYYNNNDNNKKKKKKNNFIKFSLLTNLFRSKKPDLNGSGSGSDHPRVSNSVTGETASATSSTSSPSWFSVKSRRNKHKQPVVNGVVNGVVRKQFCPDRGMSPARYSDCGEDFCDSGYESCESRKQTPWRTPARRVNSTSATGLAFCLSPLVRASPCRNWNQKTPPVTTVMTAVDGGAVRSFCGNRSRKLADFGRLNPNR